MRKIITHNAYDKSLKNIQKIKGSKIEDDIKIIVSKLSKDEHPGCSVHCLHKTATNKSGMAGLRELHITGELLLIFRKVDNNLELVDICRNHKDLKKRY